MSNRTRRISGGPAVRFIRWFAGVLYEKDDAERRIANMSGEWISVAERLPEMNETVMVGHSEDGWVGTGERVLTGAYLHWADDGEELFDPTHWMPLPAPPTTTK